MTATRFVVPLREGGSLPGLVEADDLGTYVVKFCGAGQGLKVLVAEVLVAGIARLVGMPVPAARGRRHAERDRPLRGRRGGPGPAQRAASAPTSASTSSRAPRLRRLAPTDAEIAERIIWLDA